MAQLTGPTQLFNRDTHQVDSSATHPLGTRAWDSDGNEYIYLQGTASVVARDWVIYDEDFTTTRLVANEVGPVAVAATAIVNGEYGWFQIYGVAQGNADAVDADKSLYIDGTAGRVDDLSVDGDLVIGAYSMTAAVSNVATVYITYPHVSNDLGGSSGGISGPVSSTDNAVVRWNGTGGSDIQNSGVIVDDSDNITATATITVANEGIHILDTNDSHDLILKAGSNLTADRKLTLTTGDSDIELNLAGSTTISTFGATLTDDASAGAARTTLGATTAGGNVFTLSNPSAVRYIKINADNTVTAQSTTDVRTDLDIGTLATQNANNVAITGGSIAGIADLALADGGTGTTLVDPAADRLMFWDDSESTVDWLTAGSGLTISGKTITAAGGGATSTTIIRWLKAGEAALPNSGFAGLNKVGTTWVMNVLDYDSTSTESAYFYTQLPNGISIGTVTMDLVWFCSTGFVATSSDNVRWDVGIRAVDNGEGIDTDLSPAVATTSVTGTTTANGTTAITQATISTTGWASGDILQIRLNRNPGHADDDLAADARLVGAQLRIE